MRLTVPPLEVDECSGFDSEVDIFNRAEFGKELVNLILNTENELVVALDSPWGEGKSTFIKMWKGFLNEKEIPAIYFDAFENDYQKDAFLAISRQIYKLMEENSESVANSFKSKATSALKVLGRSAIRVSTRVVTAGIIDETLLEGAGIKNEASTIVDNFISNQFAQAQSDEKSLEDFKNHLSDLAKETSKYGRIIFIIDELDRCKPSFALEVIESIKHLFSVPNIVFVLAMNSEQIEECIRSEYGRGINARKYLHKFINIWCSLPKTGTRYSSIHKQYLNYCLSAMDFESNCRSHETAIELYGDLATHYNMSLREIEKSLTNFAIIHNITEGNLNTDYLCLAVYISIVKVNCPRTFVKLKDRSIGYSDAINETNLLHFDAEWWEDKPEGHYIKWLLKYFLGNEHEVKTLLQQGNFLENRIASNHNAVTNICKWLETFKRNI